ncbi:predicted protein [Ostreococcus lucimarinus CCE9901]|uniref:Prefoldin subunit 6 n=1 Tax=Ostreococcus lucimarinus (strain CCE9901) TaxID=436017 RepID=A4RRI2_OSTLU|nr:predicted protein [Ostreococcus lucimarinus CCE9901]ABO93865.1 predicted protein [Ostreococcus lucimarinus CCE9901]|eukprot:XP_001415573.1 predicted protein [Ostreococcus lucimarinus CCE9901]
MASAMDAFQGMQRKLQEESRTYESLAQEMNANVIARQQAQQQLSENEMVLKELELLEDEAKVYKLVGPVLMKQDLVEARGNVEKRLDYIRAENERLEKAAKAMQKKQTEKQEGIIALQQQMMKLANPSGGESA